MTPILEVRNITKRFPGVLANDRVILLWIVSLRGEPLPSPLYWVAPLIGTAVWPWLFLLLDRYRGVMRQRAAR